MGNPSGDQGGDQRSRDLGVYRPLKWVTVVVTHF